LSSSCCKASRASASSATTDARPKTVTPAYSTLNSSAVEAGRSRPIVATPKQTRPSDSTFDRVRPVRAVCR
jgi:hypothetical protein